MHNSSNLRAANFKCWCRWGRLQLPTHKLNFVKQGNKILRWLPFTRASAHKIEVFVEGLWQQQCLQDNLYSCSQTERQMCRLNVHTFTHVSAQRTSAKSARGTALVSLSRNWSWRPTSSSRSPPGLSNKPPG